MYLSFLATGAMVVVAAAFLTRFADDLAIGTGLGRVWAGALLLAVATSLPELATDLTAVRMGLPDLAVGDLFGSSLANMVILAIVDLAPPRGRLLGGANPSHAVTAAQAIVLNALAALFVLLAPTGEVLGVGLGPATLLAAYLLGARVLFRSAPPSPGPADTARRSVGRAVAGFLVCAATVFLAAPTFAHAAAGIAQETGLGETFVGTALVGLSTSLPELVACVSAARLRAFDLAVGNLFGSNAFNMAVFVALDLAHPGSLFAALDPAHALSALLAVVLMGLGIAAMGYRRDPAIPILDPDSVAILLVYLAGMGLLYAKAAG